MAQKPARNRMDLLLIVSDVLHTDKFHRRSATKQGYVGSECGGFVVDLIEQAAACITEKGSQLETKLRAIINYWAVNQLVSADILKACRDRADETLFIAQGGTPVRKRNYLLPEYHGDRTAPWYDLPASYMLEPMIKHPKRPIDASQIKIQKLDKKPVSPHVRNLLDNFFEKVDLKYLPTGDNPTGETPKYKLSLDPMGQVIKHDKETGETATVANGYGWSMKFCQDMQKHGVPENIKIAREDIRRMEEDVEPAPDMSATRRNDRRQRRSSSSDSDYRRERRRYSRSRSRSYTRRGSDSSYDSRRSPPRSRSRDMGQGRRKVSPRQGRRGSDDRDQRFENRGPNQLRQPPRPQDRDGHQRESQWDRNTHGSPGNQYQAPPMPPHNHAQPYSQPPQPPFNAPPFPPPPGQFQGQYSMPMPPFGVPPPPPPQLQGAAGFAPPPPPPNYNGPWPPPPPNMNVPPNGPQQHTQYGNNFSPNNKVPYNQNQNQGSYQGGRGYGGPQRGGYNGNRGGWRGTGRGGRF